MNGMLRINGEPVSRPATPTLAALLADLNLQGKRVAVERNGEIVPRSAHATTMLAPGDRLEIVVAGVGTASDAAIALELGCDGVLMNTAIAAAREPVLMARAMRLAVEAGRAVWLAGRMPRRPYAASPSSPIEGLIQAAA